jgi:hypothetical protein
MALATRSIVSTSPKRGVKYFTLSKKLMTVARRFFCLATAAKTGKPGPSIAVEDPHKLLR